MPGVWRWMTCIEQMTVKKRKLTKQIPAYGFDGGCKRVDAIPADVLACGCR